MAKLTLLTPGSRGPQTAVLQLGLRRYGFSLNPDGIFGPPTERALRLFQVQNALVSDGAAGPQTWTALRPWLTGSLIHTVRRGQTLYSLAQRYQTTLDDIETANPGLDPSRLTVGSRLTVPLPFDVVPTQIPMTSTVLELCVQGLAARYPFLSVSQIGSSVMGSPLWMLQMGAGSRSVLCNAAHHANEWITTPLVLVFLEQYAKAYAHAGQIAGIPAESLFRETTLALIPMVNPDGADLVTGELAEGPYYSQALRLARQYPAIAFPFGWKANLDGIDLNLQYPAGWEQARSIKFAQGYTTPGPRDFVGYSALQAPESRAMTQLAERLDPALTLSYHTQGQVIYWRYLDRVVPGARPIAERLGQVSGYDVSDTPYESGYAGFKDWFIDRFGRPGFTVEAGQGTSPLPLSQLPEIIRSNIPLIANAMKMA